MIDWASYGSDGAIIHRALSALARGATEEEIWASMPVDLYRRVMRKWRRISR